MMLHELRVHQAELEMQNEELRRSQAELDAARERYFDLYDMAPVGYCTIDEKGYFQETNLTAMNMLGIARRAPVKQALARAIHDEDKASYDTHRRRLFETGMPQACDVRMLKKDRSVFYAHLEMRFVKDGTPPVSRVVISDITERKHAEATLAQADKMSTLGILAAGISHEVNQPLMAISMALDNLSMKAHDAGYVMAKIDAMRSYIQRITKIIDSVRSFAREPRDDAPGSSFSPNESVRNVLSMVEEQYRVNAIALVISLSESLPAVNGNMNRFEQVVLNLLTNAAYAVHQKTLAAGPDYHGEISIVTEQKDTSVVMHIRDNGIGMSEEVKGRLFTPFFTTKPTGEGTGMGLSIIYGIVKGMRGTISVESVPGSHTEFTVALPVTSGQTAR